MRHLYLCDYEMKLSFSDVNVKEMRLDKTAESRSVRLPRLISDSAPDKAANQVSHETSLGMSYVSHSGTAVLSFR